MTWKRLFTFALAALFIGIASAPVRAAEAVTHHFNIEKPKETILIGKTMVFRIEAVDAKGKRNKDDDSEIKIDVTSGVGSRALTKSQTATLKKGEADVKIDFFEAGPTNVQVSKGDPASDAYIFNSVGVNVLTDLSKTEVRP